MSAEDDKKLVWKKLSEVPLKFNGPMFSTRLAISRYLNIPMTEVQSLTEYEVDNLMHRIKNVS